MLYKKPLLSWCHLHALASENDLTVFKNNWATLNNRTFFGDKIYINQEFIDELYIKNNAEMLTPIKVVKDQSYTLKYWDRAYNFQFSKAVSTIGQPIEGFFNWLIEKTGHPQSKQSSFNQRTTSPYFWKISCCFFDLCILTLNSHY